jgi:hypothetical protein
VLVRGTRVQESVVDKRERHVAQSRKTPCPLCSCSRQLVGRASRNVGVFEQAVRVVFDPKIDLCGTPRSWWCYWPIDNVARGSYRENDGESHDMRAHFCHGRR